jgi:hypothetical protein
MTSPIILSMSAVASWKRCRKQFDLGFQRMLNPRKTTEAAEFGTSVHWLLEKAAKHQPYTQNEQDDPMFVVADAYLQENPLPSNILLVEQPVFAHIINWGERPVYIRTTYDLVYMDEYGFYVARDYKTFAAMPTYYVDFHFQSRIYLGTLMRHFNTDKVKFEFENIRRTAPRKYDPTSKWKTADCYLNVPVSVPIPEVREQWQETQNVVHDLLRSVDENRLYREDLQVGPHSCASCFFNELCVADFQGKLDAQTVALLSTPRDPIEISPEGLLQ